VILDDLAMRPAASDQIKEEQIEIAHRPNTSPAPTCRVYCVPARAERDEFAGAMLTQLLREQSFDAHNASATIPAADLLEKLESNRSDVACISVVAPSTVIHARFLCTKLRARFPTLKIIVGLWGATERVAEATKRLHDSGADETVTSLAAAMQEITTLSAAREQLVAVTAA
jgi:methanogenic corrinoid protein MtbC1